jgi:hypothetical protein
LIQGFFFFRYRILRVLRVMPGASAGNTAGLHALRMTESDNAAM